MKTETQKITQGAMICALSALVVLLDRQTGNMILSNFSWILSIPMILYASQNQLKYSLMVFTSIILITFMFSSIQSVFYILSALILGILYGQGIYHKYSQNKLLFITIFITFISNLFFLYIFASFFGYDLVATRNEFITWIENLEILGNQPILFMDPNQLYNVIDIVSFLMLVILESLCVHLMSHLIFIKMKIDVPRIEINLNFKYPKILSIGAILSILGIMYSNNMEISETVQFILAFFYLSLFIVNFVYGIIVIRCMRQLPNIIWIAALVLPFCWPIVMILGIVDGLMNGEIRKKGLYGKIRKF